MDSVDPSQDALFASIFPRVVSKAERRKIQILEATIECFATRGIDSTAYELIAKKCGASRTLIIHYFPNRQELEMLAIQYIRADMQKAAVEAIQKAKTPEKRLEAYVQSTFDWTKEKPSFMTVWLLFFYYCGVRPEFKAMHTKLTTMGHERIIALMEGLPENKRAQKKDISLRAKTLQALITGGLVAVQAEYLSMPRSAFVAQTIHDCLRIAKGE